jgi:hypothetical protein
MFGRGVAWGVGVVQFDAVEGVALLRCGVDDEES